MKRNNQQTPHREPISKLIKKSNSKIKSTFFLIALKLTAVILIQAASSPNNATANNYAGHHQLVLNFQAKTNSSTASHQSSFPANHRMPVDDEQEDVDSGTSTGSRRSRAENRTGWQIFEGTGQETIIRPQVAVQIFATPMEAPVANSNRSASTSRRPSTSLTHRNSLTGPPKRLAQAATQADDQSDQWQPHQTRESSALSAFISVPSPSETRPNIEARDRWTTTIAGVMGGNSPFDTSKLSASTNKSIELTDSDGGNIEFSMNLNGDEIVINPVASNLVVGEESQQADALRTNFALADLVAAAGDDEIGASASSNNYNESQRADSDQKGLKWRRRRLASRSSLDSESMSSSSAAVADRQDARKSRPKSADYDEPVNSAADDDYDGELAAGSNLDVSDESLNGTAGSGGDPNGLDDESGDQAIPMNQQHSEPPEDEIERVPKNQQVRRKSRSSPSRSDSAPDADSYEQAEIRFGHQDQEEANTRSSTLGNSRNKQLARSRPAFQVKRRRLQVVENNNKLLGESDLGGYHLKRAESGSRRSASVSRAGVRTRDGTRQALDEAMDRDEPDGEGRIQRVASSSAPKLIIKGDDLRKFEQLLENLRSLSFAAGVAGGGAKIQGRSRKVTSSEEEDDQLDQQLDSRGANSTPPHRQHNQGNGSGSSQKVAQVSSKATTSLRDCLRRHDRQDKASEIVLTKEASGGQDNLDDMSNRGDGSSSWRALNQESSAPNKTTQSDESQNRDPPSASSTFESNGESDSSDFSEEQQDASNAVGTRQLQPMRTPSKAATETIPSPEAMFYRKTILQSYFEDANHSPSTEVKLNESLDEQQDLSYGKPNSKTVPTTSEQTKQHDYDSQLAQSNTETTASEPKVRHTFRIQDVPLEDNAIARAREDRPSLGKLDSRDAYQWNEFRQLNSIESKH